MRIIDYYNLAATAAMLALVLAAILLTVRAAWKGRRCAGSHGDTAGTAGSGNGADDILSGSGRDEPGSRREGLRPDGGWWCGRRYWIAAGLIIIFGAFLRLWNLTGLPDGLQQDEASIGYEAYCLASYGIDRNGYHWPVYPVTWGSGGGSPLMIYLNVITTKLLGSSVWSVRIVPAFLGTLTLVLFFAVLLKGYGRRTALTGLLLLAIMPWHIILSRWSLDSNTAPFWQLLATFVFLHAVTRPAPSESGRGTGIIRPYPAVETEKDGSGSAGRKYMAPRRGDTRWLCLAAFLFGVCMYSYGSANIVIPLTLLGLSAWGLRHGAFRFRQLALCFAVFVLTCAPLAVFYAVNFLGLPEIATDWISFPKFTSSHFGSVFLPLNDSLPENLLANLKGLVRTLTVGFSDEVSWNVMPGYWTLYKFTWPVLLAGMVWGFYRWVRDRHRRRPGAQPRKAAAERVEKTACGRTDRAEEEANASSLQRWRESVAQEREWDLSAVNAVMMTGLAAAMLFTLFIQQDVNREVFLFLPLVYCLTMGLRWIAHAGSTASQAAFRAGAGGILAGLSLLLVLAGAFSFCRDYYGGAYNEIAATDFMPGYGEAVVYADELAGQMDEAGEGENAGDAGAEDGATVYSTYSLVASPFMITLYYTKYDPYDFLDTVVYRDEEAEFRVATSFGHFVFGLPVSDTEDLSALMEEEYWGDVFVLAKAEAEQFDESLYEITWFGERFAVVVRRGAAG